MPEPPAMSERAPDGFRQPPHSVEIEQCLLGLLMVNNSALERVSDRLEPKHFYAPAHAELYEKLRARIRAGRLADPNAMCVGMDQDGKTTIWGMATAASSFLPEDIDQYADELADLWHRRHQIEIGNVLANTGYDLATPAAEWRARAAEELTQINGTTDNTVPKITSIQSAAFINQIIVPRNYVLYPWLREKGLAMIHAKAGIGKTWLALCCAYAISTGGKYLKWSAAGPRRTLYVDGEMAAQDLQERLRAIILDQPAEGFFGIVPFDLYDGPIPNIASPEGQERLADVIQPYEVIFLDNLSCLAFDGDLTDAQSWETVQQWLLALRRRGKSVILLHHSGKSGTQRGTSRRADALDTIIRLERPADATGADGCRFTVTFEKARGQLGEAGEPFEAMLQNGLWTMRDEDISMLLAVVDLTLEGKPIRKIADELGIGKNVVHRLQKVARERGLL
jgi:hypothetical protein